MTPIVKARRPQPSFDWIRVRLDRPAGITNSKGKWRYNMSSKVKVTLSLDASLVKELAAVSRKGGSARSRLVEEALRLWTRQRLEGELKAGYLEMAGEDQQTAEDHLAAGSEVLK